MQPGGQFSDQHGLPVEHLTVDREGRVLLASLEDALDEDVLAVSIMAVNNEIGTIQDIHKISELVRNAGAIFHCDAAQAPISMDLRGIAEYVDLLSPIRSQDVRTERDRRALYPQGVAGSPGTAYLRGWTTERFALRHRSYGFVRRHGRGCRTSE